MIRAILTRNPLSMLQARNSLSNNACSSQSRSVAAARRHGGPGGYDIRVVVTLSIESYLRFSTRKTLFHSKKLMRCLDLTMYETLGIFR